MFDDQGSKFEDPIQLKEMAIGFYQNDVLKAVGSFFTSSKLLSEFRPISCCNIAYKYITKILANRLKLCLADVIGPTKSAFIQGRSIAENMLLAQEMMRGGLLFY